MHDPERAPLVRRAFEDYANRRGKPLASQAIGMRLRNQLYAGIVDVPEYGGRAKRGDFDPLSGFVRCESGGRGLTAAGRKNAAVHGSKWRFAKARPEPDFRQRSKRRAVCSSRAAHGSQQRKSGASVVGVETLDFCRRARTPELLAVIARIGSVASVVAIARSSSAVAVAAARSDSAEDARTSKSSAAIRPVQSRGGTRRKYRSNELSRL